MVLGGPGRFRKVREAGMMNFQQISSKSDFMVPRYDQKPLNKKNLKKQRRFQCERTVYSMDGQNKRKNI